MPTVFDGGFVWWYFDNHCDYRNPFGHTAEDMNSMYRGIVRNTHASLRNLIPKELPHNALEDAIIQAQVFDRGVLKQL